MRRVRGVLRLELRELFRSKVKK